jgi:hypothetical protein
VLAYAERVRLGLMLPFGNAKSERFILLRRSKLRCGHSYKFSHPPTYSNPKLFVKTRIVVPPHCYANVPGQNLLEILPPGQTLPQGESPELASTGGTPARQFSSWQDLRSIPVAKFPGNFAVSTTVVNWIRTPITIMRKLTLL